MCVYWREGVEGFALCFHRVGVLTSLGLEFLGAIPSSPLLVTSREHPSSDLGPAVQLCLLLSFLGRPPRTLPLSRERLTEGEEEGVGPRRWIRSCGLGLCAASGRGLGIRLSARGQCVCSKEAAGPAQAERAQTPAQGRPHRGGVPASTSTGTDGHRKGHRLSHSWGKQDPHEQRYRHTRCKAHSHGHTHTDPPPPQVYKHRLQREKQGAGGQSGPLTETQQRGHTRGHRHARMPDTRTRAETRTQAHACTPAQHSSVLGKGDPDTHPEQKHSRAQTHPAFRHSHTL